MTENYGYHTTKIIKGQLGEASKMQEELDELKDAELQNNRIMALIELSDLYGAMSKYLENHFPGFTMEDVKVMHEATKRSFESGHRD